MVGVEHLARVHGVETLLGALGPRDREQPVEVAADHLRLRRALADLLEAGELTIGLCSNLVRHPGGLDLRAVLLDDGAVVLAELLADRVHLLAQHVLALLLVRLRLDVVAHLLAELKVGQPLVLQLERKPKALDDVDGLEQPHAILEREIGRIGAGVCEGAGLGDRSQEARDASVGTPELEDLLDHGAILAGQLVGLDRSDGLVRPLVDLGAQAAVGVGPCGPDQAAVKAFERDGTGAARQADAVAHGGDSADRRVATLVTGDEQHLGFVADVDRERGGHVREDDDVFQRNQQQLPHGKYLNGSRYKKDSVRGMGGARASGGAR